LSFGSLIELRSSITATRRNGRLRKMASFRRRYADLAAQF
jgi:hypothetical protein